MLIITLAYQYASCSSGVLVHKVIQVALYYTGHDKIGVILHLLLQGHIIMKVTVCQLLYQRTSTLVAYSRIIIPASQYTGFYSGILVHN